MSAITKKGQVTIPKEMRDSLHIKEGDSVTFELREGEIRLRKLDRVSILGLGGMLRGSAKKKRAAQVSRNVAKPVFVDTDVFLRFLLRDSEAPYNRARELFERAEAGAVKLDTTVPAFAALAAELEAYGLGRAEIKGVLKAILGTRNLRVQNRELVAEAVELLGRGMSFMDAYSSAYMKDKGITKAATFKRGPLTGEPYWKDKA